ncbi:MAG: endonuclease/exonuclease/phosphatase family protein [Treponema sp.]|jgi:endonuclease/exonuclease/phosphatase family metal-dependent hydrolase|nr:endonuclease/exonuclease/phosphatase family protein [Treponema sp.]
MMKRCGGFLLLVTALVLPVFSPGGCSLAGTEVDRAPTGLTIASWNVQALFDGGDDGFEYAEYTSGAGWNDAKYRARLNVLSTAIHGGAGDEGFNPDILALIEVEHSGVLRDLAELSGAEYGWTFFAGTPGSSIGLGVISRLPLAKTAAHSIYAAGDSIPRPVAEVWVESDAGPVVLLACHWKSKLGGEEATERIRRAEAGIIVRRLEEIAADHPGTPVVVLGDLNENYNEFQRTGGAYLCALLPDNGEAADLAAASGGGLRPGLQDYLIISRKKPPRTEFFESPVEASILYSPWADSRSQGSYYYDDAWETIDHFLINPALFDNRGWEYENFWTLEEAPFTNAKGFPYAYNPKTGNGLSDHLPIVLSLRRSGP